MPQVEQKLNAINPGSTSGKFRIYSFRITDRQTHQIALENPRGHAVASILSMLDLFSFDVLGGGPLRLNLETLFHKYEANVEVHTRSLLKKLAVGNVDIKTELIDLFAAKLLNFDRNPFCIQKVLNSFPGMGAYEPTDSELLALIDGSLVGKSPIRHIFLCASPEAVSAAPMDRNGRSTEFSRLMAATFLTIGRRKSTPGDGSIARNRSREGRLQEGPYTVADAVRDYLLEIAAEKSATAVQGAKYVFDAWILPELGSLQVEKLTTDRLNRWRNKVSTQPKRVRKKLIATEPATRETPDDEDARRARKATAQTAS